MLGKRSADGSWTWVVMAVTLGTAVACAEKRPSPAPARPPVTVRVTPKPPAAAAEATGEPSKEDENAEGDASPPVPIAAIMPDVDYWATPQVVVERMLELARVGSDDIVYDLGCGDARSLVTAAKRYGAKGVGFEIDPRVAELARENVRENGVESLVTIEEMNIFDVDLSPASVVFLYLTQRLLWRLVPQFERMRAGSRLVSHEYAIPGARPIRILKIRGPRNGPADATPEEGTVLHKIYLWKIPWQKQPTEWKRE